MSDLLGIGGTRISKLHRASILGPQTVRCPLKWFDPLIAAALALPLSGAFYIDYSSLTLGQKIEWVIFGIIMGALRSQI